MNKIDYVEQELSHLMARVRLKDERRRVGKTDKDRRSSATKRREANQAERNAYCQSSKSVNTNFPEHAARGNGNSSKRRKYYG